MVTTLDLRQLAVDRTGTEASRRRPPRHVFARYFLPLAIVVGFASLLAWSARDSLLPSKPVTVVPVVLVRAEVGESGRPLFQAAGWVEPRPSPVKVPALAEGVIERLLVVAGQTVEAGEAVATLVDADARLGLDDARAALQWEQAGLAAAQAALAAARTEIAQPVHLEAALAEAESALAKVATELAAVPFAIRAAELQQQFAREDLEGKRRSGDAVAGRVLQRAEVEYQAATAKWEELHARKTSLGAEAEALRNQCQALRTRLQLKVRETRRLAEAEAAVQSAEAKVWQAELAVKAARLRLDRMTLRAPVSGRVLALNAQPGQRVPQLAGTAQRESGGVLTLYDPQMLQVRADVRLEDVPHVQPRQPVRIESAALAGTLTGKVLTARSRADIQKNTLEVTVALDDPPPVITPEMLVRAMFLAPEQPNDATRQDDQPYRMLVPRPLVETGDGQATVWLADRLSGRARRQTVVLGNAGNGQLVEVVEGVNAMDKLVAGGREGLRHGDRITITGEAPL